ncbi:hypothetical protein B296_00057649 [Ensete ventricosum]|uniref:Uncharacterized protein n=1 Tax=Ensete ventricosum TaxID=4639 RepID=A0A426XQA7_ENSVE|nr:hypothetical protein B296_00057649 [Ensete ventricosum]
MWSVHRGGREVSSCGRGVRHARGPNNNLIRQPRTTTDKNDSRNLSTHDYRSWNVKMCVLCSYGLSDVRHVKELPKIRKIVL